MISVPNMLPQNQFATAAINPTGTHPVTGEAVPATVDGLPQWEVTQGPEVVSITPSEDGKTCDIVPTGVEGVYLVSCKVDADRGEGVRTLTAEFGGSVVGVEADNVGGTVEIKNI